MCPTHEDGEEENPGHPAAGHEDDLQNVLGLLVLPDGGGGLGGEVETPDDDDDDDGDDDDCEVEPPDVGGPLAAVDELVAADSLVGGDGEVGAGVEVDEIEHVEHLEVGVEVAGAGGSTDCL